MKKKVKKQAYTKANPILLWQGIVYLLASFPILPRGIQSSLIIILLLLSIAIKKECNVSKTDLVKIFAFTSIFLVYAVSLIYSYNINIALMLLLRVSPFLVFAIIFGLLSKRLLNHKTVQTSFMIFVMSIFIKLVYIKITLFNYFENKPVTSWRYRQEFESLTDIHGTYFSLWIGFAVLFLVNQTVFLLENKKFLLVLTSGIITAYFFYWLLTLEARLPLISTIFLCIVLVIIKIKSIKIFVITSVAFSAIIALTLAVNPNPLNKTKEMLEYNFSLPKGDYNYNFESVSSQQIRNGIYFCSYILIKDSWLIGYGVGDVDKELQRCYKENLESNVFQMFSYNSHNQYLQVWLASGIFGLILFVCSLMYLLYMAVKRHSPLLLVLLLFVFVCMLTENIFSRHDGVLVYTFFCSMLFFKGYYD